MAISLTLAANFSKFYDAVDKAGVKLKEFEDGAARVGPRLSAMVDNFSGRRVIEEAALMERAITEIGGTAKLTEKELTSVAGKATEAVSKMKALGMEVPPGLQKIADAAKPAAESVGEVNFSFAKLAATIGLGFGVQQVVSKFIEFGKAVLDDADALTKLHDKTGVALQTLQKFMVAGDDAGNSIDEITSAIVKMEDKLASGDKGAFKALEDLKIPFEDIKNLKPENQFIAISDAIRQVEDPARRVQLAIDIFGKSGAEILPTLMRGFDDLKGKTVGMADSTIENLDLVGDTMSKWYRITKGALADGIVEFARFVGAGLDPTKKALNDLIRLTQDLDKEMKEMAKAIPDIRQGPAPLPAISIDGPQVRAGLKELTDAQKKIDDANAKARKAIEDYNQTLWKLEDTMFGTDLIDKANLMIKVLGTDISRATSATRQQQDAMNKTMSDAIDVYKAHGVVAPAVMYEIYAATLKAADETTDFMYAIKTLGKESAPVYATLLAPLKEIKITEAATQLGTEAGPAYTHGLRDSLQKTMGNIPQLIVDTMKGGGSLSSVIISLGSQIGQDFSNALMEKIKANTQAGKGGAGLLTAGNIGAAGVGGAAAGIGAMAGGASVSQSIGTVASAGLSVAVMGGMTTGAIALGAATMGIGTAAIFAYYGIKKLIQSAKDIKETNKLRESFIDMGGGLDVINQKAWEAGASLDKLLAAKSPEQAKAALQELSDAFEFQAAAMELVNTTAQKYGFTLEELGPALQRQALDKQAQDLFQDFEVLNAAGLDTVAIVTRMGAATSDYINTAVKMGVEVPSAMKPMLEDMVKAGTLTDANGDAITDLEAAGVKFSLTMSDGFKNLIASVDKLATVISRSLGVALDDTASKINKIPKSVDVEVNYKQKTTGSSPEAAEGLEGFARGSDGYRDFGKGTPVMLHGWEAVVPRDGKSQGGGGDTSDGGVQIVINAQGAFFDTPESQQRLADKVATALTARYGLSNKYRAA